MGVANAKNKICSKNNVKPEPKTEIPKALYSAISSHLILPWGLFNTVDDVSLLSINLTRTP